MSTVMGDSNVGYQVGIDLGTTFTAAAIYRDGRGDHLLAG